MKNSIKLLAVVTTVMSLFFGNSAKAQSVEPSQFRFGIGLEGGLTTGNVNYISNFYAGATARLQYGLSKNFALTLTSGYYDFHGKDYIQSLGMIPVKLGVKAFLGSGFYLSGEAGAGFETNKFGSYYTNPDIGRSESTKLILSPGLGFATKSWDFGVRYENFQGQGNDYGLLGARIAYGFGL